MGIPPAIPASYRATILWTSRRESAGAGTTRLDARFAGRNLFQSPPLRLLKNSNGRVVVSQGDQRMTPDLVGPALGKISSGLYVATAQVDGSPVGMLCSFVEQAGFAPPMISLAIAPGRPITPALDSGAPFALHVLSKENTGLLKSFARGSTPESFANHELVATDYDAPVFAEAWAYLIARVVGQLPAGDHILYLAEVVDGRLQHDGQQASTRVRANGFGY